VVCNNTTAVDVSRQLNTTKVSLSPVDEHFELLKLQASEHDTIAMECEFRLE